MIAFLKGRLENALPDRITVDCHGVGYEVWIPLSTSDTLPSLGCEVTVLTHLRVREDAQVLYGFATNEERDLFRLLIDRVSGVGPKVALSILSGMPVAEFKAAVVAGDSMGIARIKGLGKKTAERVILELKDKVGVAAAWEAASNPEALSPEKREANDAILGLISLGF
ncbi:MAG: Holliday junction branch migration protein RuvA, partial [Verrucomicrobiota bacterium]